MKKYYYACDGGSIMLGTETFKAHYPNGFGDGEFKITIYDTKSKIPNEYKFVDCVEGKFNVYDYDCSGAEVLCELRGRYGIYNCRGDIILQKWND